MERSLHLRVPQRLQLRCVIAFEMRSFHVWDVVILDSVAGDAGTALKPQTAVGESCLTKMRNWNGHMNWALPLLRDNFSDAPAGYNQLSETGDRVRAVEHE